MIIFDLDGTLANYEHRRHLVDPALTKDDIYDYTDAETGELKWAYNRGSITDKVEFWKPNWNAFHEACDKDTPNEAICKLFEILALHGKSIEIWSDRSELVRVKTVEWLSKNVLGTIGCRLKIRPIGDSTPDDVLKEHWLDEALAEGKQIEMVFDDRDKVVKMWRRRGITCLQVTEGDF